MNVFNKVTLQSLKKNKTRTIVTIIGIMLSAAMICAVTTFISSIQNYALSYAIYTEGDWHGAAFDVSYNDYEVLHTNKEVENAAYAQLLGYAKVASQNEFKPYVYVMGGDSKNFFSILPVHLLSGELPKNSSEIIIPEHLLSNGGLNYHIGDVVTFELGNRMLDEFSLSQMNPCYAFDEHTNEQILNGEVLKVKETRSYTIVGIYERPKFESRTAPGYTALTISDSTALESAQFDMYFKMKDASNIYDFMSTMTWGGTTNTDVLLYSGVSNYSSFTDVLLRLAIVVIGLISFGSISLIYNAFSISVSERTKQFGLLSSIGATKKQLRKMIVFEAFCVSVIGIPLGIGVGILGISITLILIGNRFASLIAGTFDTPLRICVSWESLVIAVVVALITVLISAFIPSRRAAKVSAVDAIRQTADIKIKHRTTKTSKLTYRLFGLSGVLASKNYKRSKKKYRATVISLFMSIVLFVSTSAFSSYLMESVNGGLAPDDFDIQYRYLANHTSTAKTPDEVLELLISEEHITKGAYVVDQSISAVIENGYLTDRLLSHLESEEDIATKTIYPVIFFINDEEFEALIRKYQLDRSDYFNAENPYGIALDQIRYFDDTKQKFIELDTLSGDFCEYSCTFWGDKDEDISFSLQTNKTIIDSPFYIRSGISQLNLLYPISMIDHVLPTSDADASFYYSYFLGSSDHRASFTALKALLSENNLTSNNLDNYAENEESNKNLISILQVFSYGFIILISLIAAANVFNTISTNIHLRRRVFAMLKSVGMTQKDFTKMMNYECLLYGSKALLLGLPASAGITYLIYNSISYGYETRFRLPWTAIGIASLSVFLVVFATMLYSMSKIKKDNPIDALKNENI